MGKLHVTLFAMDILNIMQCTHLGGMEQASLRLMCGLMARGHRCRVLSLNPLGPLEDLLRENDIPATGLPYEGHLGWKSAPRLFRHLRKEHADGVIMTGHNLLAMLALGGLGKDHRLLAMHFHHGVRKQWQWRIFYRLAQPRFNAISFPSDFVRHEAEAIYPDIKSLARTIRNPLEPPLKQSASLKRAARARLGLPADVLIVGNAGWLIDRKRFDVFLQTASRVIAEERQVRFVIAGDGPMGEELKALASNLGIADSVIWIGWQKSMKDFYHAIDLLLFNSDWDAMGNTPLEAMAHGIPVVASVLHGGLKEIISNRQFGYVIDRHDPEQLARAIEQVFHSNGLYEQGRRHVIALSDPEYIAGQVEHILRFGVEPVFLQTSFQSS